MPRKSTVEKKESPSSADFIKLGESYTSLVLGIVVVIVATILLLSVVHNRGKKAKQDPTQIAQVIDKAAQEKMDESENEKGVYAVAQGDSLWTIAEKTYRSGYNWVDIARANKLSNPNNLEVGMKLTLPKVESKLAAKPTQVKSLPEQVIPKQAEKITDSSYTVVKGDDLWNISVRAYGDGYQWVKLARVNNLSNPNIIHAGNKLNIPRK